MNCELVYQQDFDRAKDLAQRNGRNIHEAIAILLESKTRFADCGIDANGVNGSDLLDKLCRALIEDPFAALSCNQSSSISEIRRSYKRMALAYHPDKNRFTSHLFQIIQTCYMSLTESPKSGEDGKQTDPQPDAVKPANITSKPRHRNPSPPPLTPRSSMHRDFKASHQQQEPIKCPRVPPMDPSTLPKSGNPFHSFNKQFYSEYVRASKQGAYSKLDTGINQTTNAPTSQGRETGPPRPQNIRCTARTSTGVTVEWKGCGFARSTAYEVQWRSRNDQSSVTPWHTASQFILSTKCKKNNLIPNTRYEFRIRAASAWGWSLHSDILIVCTLSDLNPQQQESVHPSPLADCTGDNDWMCCVCGRNSSMNDPCCRTCGAGKDYDIQHTSKSENGSSVVNPDFMPPSLQTDFCCDDNDNDNEEETWEYDPYVDQDLDIRIFALCKLVTNLHNVRLEPKKSSSIVGLLLADREIHVFGEHGDWLKVEYHERFRDEHDTLSEKESKKHGWCLAKNSAGQEFLSQNAALELHQRVKSSTTTNDSMMFWFSQKFSANQTSKQTLSAVGGVKEETKESWFELRDDSGDLYYFNSLSGESKWEPPTWIDYTDETSGSVYYFNTVTQLSSWEVPVDYVPIIREEVYSTPEASFAKSVLSPKRSNPLKTNKSPV